MFELYYGLHHFSISVLVHKWPFTSFGLIYPYPSLCVCVYVFAFYADQMAHSVVSPLEGGTLGPRCRSGGSAAAVGALRGSRVAGSFPQRGAAAVPWSSVLTQSCFSEYSAVQLVCALEE